jgi:hypothetical protein
VRSPSPVIESPFTGDGHGFANQGFWHGLMQTFLSPYAPLCQQATRMMNYHRIRRNRRTLYHRSGYGWPLTWQGTLESSTAARSTIGVHCWLVGRHQQRANGCEYAGSVAGCSTKLLHQKQVCSAPLTTSSLFCRVQPLSWLVRWLCSSRYAANRPGLSGRTSAACPSQTTSTTV